MTERNSPDQRGRAVTWIPASRAFAVIMVIAALATLAAPAPGLAKPPPALKGPVATVGDRTVEAIDIIQAGRALAAQSGRDTTPASWRRYLLNRCIDRELLGMEAERRGLAAEPAVRARIADREFLLLKQRLESLVLIPGITPDPTEFAKIKADGLYRYFDLFYILVRDDAGGTRRPIAERVAMHARAGGAWDSLARIYSGHPPSAAGGGHFGPTLVRDVDPAAHADVLAGSVGDILGPYSGPFGHEVYKLGEFIPIDDDSLMRLLIDERTRQIWPRNDKRLLEKYRFKPDPPVARMALRALGSETPDSILASLRPDGTRPKQGVRAALGVVARVDGDSVTIGDILRDVRPTTNHRGVASVRNEEALAALAARFLLPRLLVRDAREQGLADDPATARALRLFRDDEATRAMVARERPPDPDAAALRAYVDGHAARYRLPPARRATVVMFPNADSARAALKAWNGAGPPAESTLARMGFRPVPRPGVSPPIAGWTASSLYHENGADPLSISVRGLDSGQYAPVTRLPQGWAVVCVTGREDARAMTDEEAAPRALRDWREEADNQWVTTLLERLRAKTAVKIIPARLDAVRLVEQASRNGSGS
jgi:hypothetical protein